MTSEIPSPSVAPFRPGAALTFGWKRTWKNFWWLLLAAVIISAISSAVSSVISLTVGNSTLNGPLQDAYLLFSFSDPSTYGEMIKPLVAVSGVPLAIAGIGGIVQFIVTSFFSLGVVRTSLAVTTGDRVEISNLFSFHGFARYLVSSVIVFILASVAVLLPLVGGIAITISSNNLVWASIGAVLAIIAGLLISLLFCLFGYAILGEDAKGVSSLGQSWRLVKSHFWAVLGLQVLLSLIVIGVLATAVVGGAITCGIGLIATIPMALTLMLGIPALAYAYTYRVLSGQPVV